MNAYVKSNQILVIFNMLPFYEWDIENVQWVVFLISNFKEIIISITLLICIRCVYRACGRVLKRERERERERGREGRERERWWTYKDYTPFPNSKFIHKVTPEPLPSPRYQCPINWATLLQKTENCFSFENTWYTDGTFTDLVCSLCISSVQKRSSIIHYCLTWISIGKLLLRCLWWVIIIKQWCCQPGSVQKKSLR